MRSSWALRGVALSCAGALVLGIATSGDSDLVPRVGLGYALGVAGLAQMALLLGYSLRKRLAVLRGAGSIRRWFELHMMLGLLGPTAVLFHCNFTLGSPNAAVSLFATLGVAGSGIFGRFLYARLHHGLLGERRTLVELRRELRDAHGILARSVTLVPGLGAELDAYERFALSPAGGVVRSFWRFVTLGVRTLSLRFSVRLRIARRTRTIGIDERGGLVRALDCYLDSVCRSALLGAYEWLFGLWHAIHLPLCVVLFASAAVHVVAVHMY